MAESVSRPVPDAPGPGLTARPKLPALVVALDVPTADAALDFAQSLSALPLWYKVGLELFSAEGPLLVTSLTQRAFAVFLDLKYHDIPNTVRGAVRSASRLGVGMLSVHLAGGEAMCRAALAGRNDVFGEHAQNGPLLMGITVLTSQAGDAAAIRKEVVRLALMAKACGLDGVVCSGHEAAAVKAACGADFYCLCPGIRFAGKDDAGDQARVCTPAQAVGNGADFLVMGRPVLGAASPVAAARTALTEMGRHV